LRLYGLGDFGRIRIRARGHTGSNRGSRVALAEGRSANRTSRRAKVVSKSCCKPAGRVLDLRTCRRASLGQYFKVRTCPITYEEMAPLSCFVTRHGESSSERLAFARRFGCLARLTRRGCCPFCCRGFPERIAGVRLMRQKRVHSEGFDPQTSVPEMAVAALCCISTSGATLKVRSPPRWCDSPPREAWPGQLAMKPQEKCHLARRSHKMGLKNRGNCSGSFGA
jgi:hypothetical protein